MQKKFAGGSSVHVSRLRRPYPGATPPRPHTDDQHTDDSRADDAHTDRQHTHDQHTVQAPQ